MVGNRAAFYYNANMSTKQPTQLQKAADRSMRLRFELNPNKVLYS